MTSEARPLGVTGPVPSVAFKRRWLNQRAGDRIPPNRSPVAAEQGLIGLAFYLRCWPASCRAAGRNAKGDARPRCPAALVRPGPRTPCRQGRHPAAFVAVLVHTLTYAGFLDDPLPGPDRHRL